MAQQGRTRRQIAEALAADQEVIKKDVKWLREGGLLPPASPQQPDERRRAAIVALYEADSPITQIAESLGLHRRTVYKHLDDAGLSRPGPGRPKARRTT